MLIALANIVDVVTMSGQQAPLTDNAPTLRFSKGSLMIVSILLTAVTTLVGGLLAGLGGVVAVVGSIL